MFDRSRFSLNRIIWPALDLDDFFRLTRDVGLSKVELRNDLAGGRILDDRSANQVKALADRYGISILTINAVQKFNLAAVRSQVLAAAEAMLKVASAIGCEGVVLCPNNDLADGRPPENAFKETVAALKSLAPLFDKYGTVGLIEPLGFVECSLPSKDTALEAIKEAGFDGYKLIHDTFHHHIGPDDVFHPTHTGLVHISGVEADIPASQFRDAHRTLVGPADRLQNRAQIEQLISSGYKGDFSFEPFSEEVHRLGSEAIMAKLRESMAYILGPT